MSEAKSLILPRRNDDPDLGRGSVFFVGTATVIIRYAGFTILTDPNFLHAGDHVHLGYGLTSRRQTNPAIEIEDLPSLDFVLLSHLHGDHFDRVAQRKLNKATPIVSTRHATSYLGKVGFTTTQALETWEPLTVEKGESRVRVTAMPGTHGPGPLGAVLPPVMGSMLEFGTGGETRLRMYISGDTLIHNRLREIPRRFPDVDLALLHLGGTRVLGILVTMDADQGVEAMRIIARRPPSRSTTTTTRSSSLRWRISSGRRRPQALGGGSATWRTERPTSSRCRLARDPGGASRCWGRRSARGRVRGRW